MPKVRALNPHQAKRTLLARFAPRADRLRQLNTRFGARPYRVFLVWASWTGTERGEGEEVVLRREELLPTPKVSDLSAQQLTAFSGGVLPVGSVRLTEVSATYTFDLLTGRMMPEAHEDHVPQPTSFHYELVEDGRADPNPLRAKFRLAAQPFLDASKLQWVMVLERASEDAGRDGRSLAGDDEGIPAV